MITDYQTENLQLRILSPDWALPVLQFYENNKKRFEPWEPAHPEDFYTIEYQKRILYYDYLAFQKGTFVRFWFFRKEDPSIPIGTISFHNIIHGIFKSCSIGYKSDLQYVQKGYTLEALKQAMLIMFTSFKIHRIEALIHTKNIPSICFIEKAGFQKEGVRISYAYLNGTWHDHICYSFINPFDPL